MNAKQVADELENIYWIQGDGKGKPFQQYAYFVRQQQAEIEALKSKTLTDEEILDVLKKIADNNEYVYSLYEDFEEVEFSRLGIFEFARAILRKAQEK
jgi:hypothetical protein